MLYSLIKIFYQLGLLVFYKNFEIRNRKLIPEEGPLLVVSNHPNTFMDPIITATILNQPIYFIAKSTVFGSRLQNWFLRQLHLIPIHRKEDFPDQRVSNKDAFTFCLKALKEDKALLIFPEGNSYNQRRLRQIKTGTARIALEAASAYDVPIKILPIGLNYSAATRFRSNVFVNIGEPIEVSDYLIAYKQNRNEAVGNLTEQIKHCLQRLIVHTDSDEEDELSRKVESLFKSHLKMTLPASTSEHEHDFKLTRAIVRSVKYYCQSAPERVAKLRESINDYLLQLKRLKLQDAILGKGESDVVNHSILGLAFLLLGMPFYLYGLIHNYIPYIIPSKVANALTPDEEWRAPIMLTVGMFSFPIFYALEVWFVWKLFHPLPLWLALYLTTLPLSGFFTLGYWNKVLNTKEHWLLLMLFYKRQHIVEKLRKQRQRIIFELEQARQDYLQDTRKANA